MKSGGGGAEVLRWGGAGEMLGVLGRLTRMRLGWQLCFELCNK